MRGQDYAALAIMLLLVVALAIAHFKGTKGER